MSLVLLCSPGEVYKNMSAQETSEAYEHMAIVGYDKLVSFADGYDPEREDILISDVSYKQNIPIDMVAFVHQPIIGIDKEIFSEPWLSSSYLFGPRSGSGCLLPDLDVIEGEGKNSLERLRLIESFYREHNWLTELYDQKAPRLEVKISNGRFEGDTTSILNPGTIMEVARQSAGLIYNPNELAFKSE